jgi:broad specificity phosphatase PhoE
MGAIYLLRHGQASFGSDNYDQLSPLGHRQARLLGEALRSRGVKPDALFSGAMQRHRDTALGALPAWPEADALRQAAPGTDPWSTHPGINEFDHENVIAVAEPRYADKQVLMQGMAAAPDPRLAFRTFFRDAVARWVGGHHDAEYAEPWSVFKRRVVAALDDIVRQAPPKGDTLVFTSGGVISVVCAHLLGLSDLQAFTINWTLANAGITKLQSGRDGLHLISVNEHAHLEGAEPAVLSFR